MIRHDHELTLLPEFQAKQKLGKPVFCSPNFEAICSASQTLQVTNVNLTPVLFEGYAR